MDTTNGLTNHKCHGCTYPDNEITGPCTGNLGLGCVGDWRCCEEIDNVCGSCGSCDNPRDCEKTYCTAIRDHREECAKENISPIKWRPASEIPTEHWDKNNAISPLYLVKCEGTIQGHPIIGYTHYSFAAGSWMDCFQATAPGFHKVLKWTDSEI